MSAAQKLFAFAKAIAGIKSKRWATGKAKIATIPGSETEGIAVNESTMFTRPTTPEILMPQRPLPTLHKAEAAARDIKYVTKSDSNTGNPEHGAEGPGIWVNAYTTNPAHGLLRMLDLMNYNETAN